MLVCLSEVGELYVLRQPFYLRIGQHDELLVSGRIDVEVVTFFLKKLFHLHGHVDGVARQLKIKVVGEQCFKLQTDKCSLGNDGTMLLLDETQEDGEWAGNGYGTASYG